MTGGCVLASSGVLIERLPPRATLVPPVVLFARASSPRAVLLLVKHPSSQVARASGATARQTRVSGMIIWVGVFISAAHCRKSERVKARENRRRLMHDGQRQVIPVAALVLSL